MIRDRSGSDDNYIETKITSTSTSRLTISNLSTISSNFAIQMTTGIGTVALYGTRNIKIY